MSDQSRRERPQQGGLTYEAYRTLLEQSATDVQLEGLSGEDLERARHLPLNLRRSQRNEKTFVVPEPLTAAITSIRTPQHWIVLTEPWCGDSAQSLPLIARVAALSSQIDLRILLRDENPALMDAYLTDGKRAIPKLIAFGVQGGELFTWGPRPREAAQLFAAEKQAGGTKEQILEKLHLWYARNRGQAFAAEFMELLQKVASGPAG